jgi:hypothetical protein
MTKDEVLAVLRFACGVEGSTPPASHRAFDEAIAAVAALYEERQWRKTKDERPADGQLIAYYFEPFGTLNVGKYEEKYDTVAGRAGFTTMTPEVPIWFALPPTPEADQ